MGSRGDAIVNVGDRFINTPTSYDILGFGKYQAEDSLPPFSLTVKKFKAEYDPVTNAAIDYKLTVLTANPALAGTGFDPVNCVPFNEGDPPETVIVAVVFAQFDV